MPTTLLNGPLQLPPDFHPGGLLITPVGAALALLVGFALLAAFTRSTRAIALFALAWLATALMVAFPPIDIDESPTLLFGQLGAWLFIIFYLLVADHMTRADPRTSPPLSARLSPCLDLALVALVAITRITLGFAAVPLENSLFGTLGAAYALQGTNPYAVNDLWWFTTPGLYGPSIFIINLPGALFGHLAQPLLWGAARDAAWPALANTAATLAATRLNATLIELAMFALLARLAAPGTRFFFAALWMLFPLSFAASEIALNDFTFALLAAAATVVVASSPVAAVAIATFAGIGKLTAFSILPALALFVPARRRLQTALALFASLAAGFFAWGYLLFTATGTSILSMFFDHQAQAPRRIWVSVWTGLTIDIDPQLSVVIRFALGTAIALALIHRAVTLTRAGTPTTAQRLALAAAFSTLPAIVTNFLHVGYCVLPSFLFICALAAHTATPPATTASSLPPLSLSGGKG